MTECVSACETIKGWDFYSKTCFKIEIDRWRWIKLILTNRLLSSVWEEILVQLWLRSYNLLPVYCICDVNTWNSWTGQPIEPNFQCMILAVMRPFSSYLPNKVALITARIIHWNKLLTSYQNKICSTEHCVYFSVLCSDIFG